MLLLMLPAPLRAAATPETSATLLWQDALARIGTHDFQVAIPLLDDLRYRQDFPRTREANFLLGIALYRQQRWQEAADVLEPAATQVPLLGDYALYYAASAYQALGLHARALAMLSRLLREHPESLLIERVRQERAKLYLDTDQLVQAEEAYKEVLSRATGEVKRREALLALAEIAVKTDEQRKAEAVLRELWLKSPGSREAARAGELLTSMAEAPPFTLDEQFERALNLYRSNQYAQAITAFTPFLPVPDSDRGSDSSPPLDGAQDRFASRARLWSGISYFQRRDYSRAISLLSSLSQDRSIHAAEALYWIGRCYARTDDRNKAIATWNRLVRAYPNSPFTAESLYLTALQYSDDGQPKQAVRTLSRLLKTHPTGRFAEAALWTRAWIYYRQSALSKALADLQRLSAQAAPDSRFGAQAFYWQGRMFEGLKKKEKAVDVYRGLLRIYSDENYYAEQTRLRLTVLEPSAARALTSVTNQRSEAPIPHTLDPLPCSSNPTPCSSETAKARLLKELNLREEASEEFWALAGRSAGDHRLLYEANSALLDLGAFEKSLSVAKRLLRPLHARSRPAEPVPRYWEFLYPLAYWELVQEQSARHTLDPYLVVALMREESAFGERVVSSSGAVGLMQLLPTTANDLVKAAGHSGDSPKLDAPANNIALGTRYLAMMIEEFKGNWARAIAGYNAGPHQVRRWLGRLGDCTDDEFIEEIPFSETRAYVKRVLGSFYRYRAQYSKG